MLLERAQHYRCDGNILLENDFFVESIMANRSYMEGSINGLVPPSI